MKYQIKIDRFATFWVSLGGEPFQAFPPHHDLWDFMYDCYQMQESLNRIGIICDDYPDSKLARIIEETL